MSSFGIVHHFKGGTREQYENTVKVVHPPDGLPPGQTLHVAGPSGDGWVVIALWDSLATWEDFRDNTLLPGLGQAENGFGGPPEEITLDIQVEQS
jgi:hypothetical protein